MPLVHIVVAALRSDVPATAIDASLDLAHALEAAPAVEACVVARSDTHLLAAVWLADATALEPFAASEAHMTFVMRGLAPVVSGMWSASVSCDRPAPLPDAAPPAAAWVFALPETEGVFEWQVRRLLATLDDLPGIAWAGPTVEERERYRAGGVVLLDASALAPFLDARVTLDADLEGAASLTAALATVVTP